MGGCLSSSKPNIVENVNGGEESYHNVYLEDKLLGEGEFGMVKMVHDMRNNNVCAVKILRKGIVFKDNVVYSPLKPQVLKNEVQMLRILNGKHYCLGLLGVYETPKSIYIVTELCSGGEMMEYVSQQEDLRTEDVSRIIYQLLDAVHHMCRNNIIHRDLKPENIMFCTNMPGSDLRVIDFGSGVLDEAPSPPLIHTTFAGSAFYLSPEMFQRSYTSKTDVWSCGATLYVLVAGYPADELQKAFNIMHKSKNRHLRELPNMPEDMPDSFYDLLEQLLYYRHKQRKSAGELLGHEFVQFYKSYENNGSLSVLENVIVQDSSSSLAPPPPLPSTTGGDGSTKNNPTKSMRLTSSVKRHTLFLDYQRLERSVTTLLATLLSKQDFNVLLEKLQQRTSQEEELNVMDASSKSMEVVKPKTLNIIPISELKTILQEMNQTKWYVIFDIDCVCCVNVETYRTGDYSPLFYPYLSLSILSTVWRISINCPMLLVTRDSPIMWNSCHNSNERRKSLEVTCWNDVILLPQGKRKLPVFMVPMSTRI